ncbi:hypothetical protein LUZ60_008473 [Juncus effusus]|nr:hypothetical protein LUZ60_008473 [Juncus effusus]
MSYNRTCSTVDTNGVSSLVCLTDGQWKAAADAITIIIATSLLAGLILAVTRNRLWFGGKIFVSILGFVSDPLYTWMCQFTLLVLQIPYNNAFYLAWIVLFFIQFGTFYSLLGYLSEDGKDKRKEVKFREKLNFTSNINVLWVLLFIPTEQEFLVPFFVLWALSILKIGERYWSFDASDRMYGTANTKLISLYMETESEVNKDYDPSTMRGYKYLVHGEEDIVVGPSNYVACVKMANVTTIDEVWDCKGNLLHNPGDVSDRLKDTCLSFSLFKLLKRRMEGYPTAEYKKPKTRDLTLELLSKGEERVFRVIKSELGFLSDLMHARQPVVFGIWVVIYNILVFGIVGVILWIALKIHKQKKLANKDYSKIDAGLTEILVGFVLFTELWGLTSTFCSDWAKTTIICMYVKYYKIIDFMRLDKLLRLAWFRSFPRALGNSIPQYSLLNNAAVSCSSRLWCCLSCSLGGKTIKKGKKTSQPVKVSTEMKRAVCCYMKDLFNGPNPTLTNGSSTLLRHGMSEVLGWACGTKRHEHTHADTIFTWHIATTFCQMELESRKDQNNTDFESCKNVAVTLSNYCAFLFVLEPELVPIDACTNEKIFNKILDETREFFADCEKSKRYQHMVDGDISENTIIKNGVSLGRQLIAEIKNDVQRWKLLEEFWAELIVFLAPSKNHKIHEQKLAQGGQFITFIWVLLYHAGSVKRPSKKAAHDEIPPV